MHYFSVPILFLLLASALTAQNLPIKTVSVFKNQRALVLREGKVPSENGIFSITELPDALWGTFWMDGADLDYVYSTIDSSQTIREADSASDYLSANVGKKIKVWLNPNANQLQEMEGVLVKVVGDPSAVFSNALTIRSVPNPAQTSLVIRKTDGAHLIINHSQISHFELLDGINFQIAAQTVQKRLDLGFKSKKKEQQISQQYLTGGIGWTPIYRLDLLDKSNGKLSLRAELLNDAENLTATELRLMVGMPNFMYATKLSDMLAFPMLGQSRFNTVASVSAGARNIASQTVTFNPESYEEMVVNVPGDGSGGTQAEDYFFYTVKTGDFPKNSRYQVPVFSTDIKTTHYYECVLKAISASQIRNNRYNQNGNDRYVVNHLVEFRNENQFPWTTGAANIATTVGKDLQPISQDMLPYTASGGKCKVKIAETPEIQVSHIEGTTATTPNALQYWNHHYDKASIEGQICVVNYKNENVTIKIRRNVEGTMLESDEKWSVTQEEASLSVNRNNEVLWEIELLPNEEKKWKYSYEVFGDW